MANVDSKGLQIIAAFIFGVVFVSVILTLVFNTDIIDTNKMWVIKTVMALAAAGIAAILPGFIDLKGAIPGLNVKMIRSGGALAVFCLVFLAPISTGPDTIPKPYTPTTNPIMKADEWIAGISNKDYVGSYNNLFNLAKKKYSEDDIRSQLSPLMNRLGNLTSKRVINSLTFKSPPALMSDSGVYSQISYRAKFDNYAADLYVEILLIGEKESQDWRVYRYTLGEFTSDGVVVPLKI